MVRFSNAMRCSAMGPGGSTWTELFQNKVVGGFDNKLNRSVGAGASL